MTYKELKEKCCWLTAHEKNIFSQTGEDGIIQKILELIPEKNYWCVEFGAWNALLNSNTWKLISENKYRAVLIEGNPVKFEDLKKNITDKPGVIPLCRWVGWDNDYKLDLILSETPIPKNFDLLSIDIDGNDYHVWDALKNFRPKIVLIEYNPTIPNEVDFVQKANIKVSHGNSLASLVRLGKVKGYELVAVTDLNAIFVDACYYDRFNIPDNCLEIMRPYHKYNTYVFFGYDATVFVRGFGRGTWHGARLHEKAIQILPRFLRGWIEQPSYIRRCLIYGYSSLKKYGII